MNALKKTKHIIRNIWQAIYKDLALTAEEFRAIARNQSYGARYPKLFAIFAIIEHEQSPHVFEANHDDFQIIKTDILQNEDANNHQILEALRGLFQNSNLLDNTHEIKNQIAQYLYAEASNMVRVSDRYYMPLIKAILRGFPFLLNYDDYAIFKKLLQQKTKASLRVIKYVLENEFGSFFYNNEDPGLLLLMAREYENKAAYMLIARYIRQNKLWDSYFYCDKSSLKNKLCDAHLLKKNNLDYLIIALAYFEDKYFENLKYKSDVEHVLQDLFTHHLGIKKSEKRRNYAYIYFLITKAKNFGYQNDILVAMIEQLACMIKENKKSFVKLKFKELTSSRKIQSIRPSAQMQPRGFFAVSPLAPEEYWLLENAAYLL